MYAMLTFLFFLGVSSATGSSCSSGTSFLACLTGAYDLQFNLVRVELIKMSSSHLTLLLKRVFGLILILILWFIFSLSPLCRSLVRKIINRQSNNMSYWERYLLLLGSLGRTSVLVSFGRGFLSGLHRDEHALFGFVRAKWLQTHLLLGRGLLVLGLVLLDLFDPGRCRNVPFLDCHQKVSETHIYCHY